MDLREHTYFFDCYPNFQVRKPVHLKMNLDNLAVLDDISVCLGEMRFSLDYVIVSRLK